MGQKNVTLHLAKADYQLRMALGGIQRQYPDSPYVQRVGHAIATLREVRRALLAERQKARQKSDEIPDGPVPGWVASEGIGWMG